jgi:hypothetical protein
MMLAAMLVLMLVVFAPAALAADNNNNDNFRFNNFNRFNNGFPVVNAVGQESETGNVNIGFNATQSGNNSNQCVTPLQFGNTGSLQNGQAVLNTGTPFFNNNGRFFDHNNNNRFFNNDGRFFNDGFTNGFFTPVGATQLEGSTFTFTPTLNATCNQQVQQSAAAG